MNILINRLTAQDWQIYHQLHLEALGESGGFFSLTVPEELARPEAKIKRELKRRLIWGAFIDGKLIGKIGLSTRKRGQVKHVAKVFGLYVNPALRGKGIAKKLLEEVMMELLKRPEIEQLQLKLIKGNEVALKFYEKSGFLEFGREKAAIKVGDGYLDEIYMQKFLK